MIMTNIHQINKTVALYKLITYINKTLREENEQNSLMEAIEDLKRYQQCMTDDSFLFAAEKNFNKAIDEEQNENKVVAILGQSICILLLGNAERARVNLNKIHEVSLSLGGKVIATGCAIVIYFRNMFNPIMIDPAPINEPFPPIVKCIKAYKKELEKKKSEAIELYYMFDPSAKLNGES